MNNENHISMFAMSFTLRRNSVYTEQFSKKTRKTPEIFGNVPSLQLNKIVFDEVKNSFIDNILRLGI